MAKYTETPDFSEIAEQSVLKRSMEIGMAGMHNLLFFGPPGAGKSIAVACLSGILPSFSSRLIRHWVRSNKISHTITTIYESSDNYFNYQYVLSASPCPCGNLGIDECVCSCSTVEIEHYWKRTLGVFLDKIDIRIPVKSIEITQKFSGIDESSKCVKKRVEKAFLMQKKRFVSERYSRNSRIPVSDIKKYCLVDYETEALYHKAMRKFQLSPKACYSVMKIARTIADLSESENIERDHFLEALYHRRYGDRDIYWRELLG